MRDIEELNTDLASACAKNDCERAVQLLEAGAQADGVDTLGVPVLLEAAANADARLVALLLRQGTDPNRADRNGSTPLMEASHAGLFRISNFS